MTEVYQYLTMSLWSRPDQNHKFINALLNKGNIECSIPANSNICQWPLTLTINKVHPLIMNNMCVKFDEDAHNPLVSILFTKFRDRRAQTQTLTDGTTEALL